MKKYCMWYILLEQLHCRYYCNIKWYCWNPHNIQNGSFS